MRRSVLVFGPVALAAFVFACEDDPSGQPTVQYPEAGTFDSSAPHFDAAVPDAAQPDADSDATADAGVKPVTVLVGTRKGPKANVQVVFHDATGAVLEAKPTAADGKAVSSEGLAPAMATVVLGETDHDLITWTGVLPGDELPVLARESDQLGTVTITGPGQLTDAGADDYRGFVAGCGGVGDGINPMNVALDDTCIHGTGAVLVHARTPNGDVVGYTFNKAITGPTDGGTVQVTTGAYVQPSMVSITTSGLGGGTYGVATFAQIANETFFSDDQSSGDISQISFQAATGFADAYYASVNVLGGTGGSRLVATRLAPTANIALDFAQALPEITAATLTNADPKRPVISWTASGLDTASKGGVANIQYFKSQTETSTRWTIVVPPNATTVTAPALPAELDPILPAGDVWDQTPEVVFADSSLVADYAAFRKLHGVVTNFTYDDPMLPQNGTLRISRYRYQILQ